MLQKSGISDSISVYQENSYAFNIRAGWEWNTSLSKRWTVFYGGDLRYGYAFEKDEAIYFNAGYAQGTEQSANVFGLAPVLGIRFIINGRISLITEATFSVNYGIGERKQTSKRASVVLDVFSSHCWADTEKLPMRIIRMRW